MTLYGATNDDWTNTPDEIPRDTSLTGLTTRASSGYLSLQPDQDASSQKQSSSSNDPLEFQQDTGSNNLTKDIPERRNSTHANTVRSRRERRDSGLERSGEGNLDFERSCVVLIAENSIEAHRINNNYKFGFKKWKSHVTSRPIDARSEIVQDLYSDISKIKDVRVTTLRPSNVIYSVLFGWWLCLLYGIIGGIMFVSVIGIPYANFCWSFATYFFWPFGKFVHQVKPYRNSCSKKELAMPDIPKNDSSPDLPDCDNEASSLMRQQQPATSDDATPESSMASKCSDFWSKPASWVWTIFGLLPLLLVHFLVFAISWFFVISIPTAKVNGKMLTKILFLPPHEIVIQKTEVNIVTLDGSNSKNSEVIMYTHQSINFYYYKYTVDGVNIILSNSKIFVVLSIIIGYALDIDPIVKCVLGILAIIPLTYYIGMAITSVAAQSSFAIGALLNATFGSAVEVILMIVMLQKGVDTEDACYQELVKSSLTGSILCSILFIPGMSMVIGGLKYRTQKFNPKSASMSCTLLFLAVIGVFAPTLMASVYGEIACVHCNTRDDSAGPVNHSGWNNATVDVICQQCEKSLFDPDSSPLYGDHIRPLVYALSIVLPIAYLIGIVFTMKTHTAHIFAEFEEELKEESENAGHGTAQWSRLKSVVILFLCAVCIALCGDLISDNIQPLLTATGISEYFVGVAVLPLVSELPEVVNGVQFALQNNVNLGIEIGCSTAVQVCLVQIPLLVLANLIHDMGFFLVFNYIHLIAVVFSVLVINYIFQDGKSDYFQGAIVVIIYILFALMYLFMLTPDRVKCGSHDNEPPTINPFPITIPRWNWIPHW